MPMHRWIASAAGGTSQRLKPGPAIVRSFDRNPGVSDADGRGSFITVDMEVSSTIDLIFCVFSHNFGSPPLWRRPSTLSTGGYASPIQVSLEIEMVGNRDEKSLDRCAILTAIWRATLLYRAAIA